MDKGGRVHKLEAGNGNRKELMERAVDRCCAPLWKDFLQCPPGSPGWSQWKESERRWREVTERVLENIVSNYETRGRAPLSLQEFRSELAYARKSLKHAAVSLRRLIGPVLYLEEKTGQLEKRYRAGRKLVYKTIAQRRRPHYDHMYYHSETRRYRRFARSMSRMYRDLAYAQDWADNTQASGGRSNIYHLVDNEYRSRKEDIIRECYDVFLDQGLSYPTPGRPFAEFCYAVYDLVEGHEGASGTEGLTRAIRTVCKERGETKKARSQRRKRVNENRAIMQKTMHRVLTGEQERESQQAWEKYRRWEESRSPLREMEARYGETAVADDPLELLASLVDFEVLRPELEAALAQTEWAALAGAPMDPVLLFKVMVLQELYDLSDGEAAFQILDRGSFQRFLVLGSSEEVPDARAIRLFRLALSLAEAIQPLFDRLDKTLGQRGLAAVCGRFASPCIVDTWTCLHAPPGSAAAITSADVEVVAFTNSWSGDRKWPPEPPGSTGSRSSTGSGNLVDDGQ